MGHLEPVAGSDALAGASASPGCLPPPCPADLHLEHHQESRAQCGPCTSTARNTMNVCASQQCSPHARKNPHHGLPEPAASGKAWQSDHGFLLQSTD